MIFQLTVICLVWGHVVSSYDDLQSPVLSIPRLGLIRGNYGKSYFTERPLFEFLGISYAKPPSGDRRFRPPEPAGPWNGVYNATKMRQRCPQIDQAYYPSPDPDQLDQKEDIEDCLVLNVFTPQINPHKGGMPVMFFTHGGSFQFGSAYDFLPDFLLETDIVLVVPQYRLGVLGFLSLNTTDVPGNAGILDILLALRWVKTNIRYFGGDPSKITVVGQSAGAALTSSLLVSPLVEQGLYDKMIIQSGSVVGEWAVDPDPVKAGRGIARILGCQTDDLERMTSCMKAMPPLDMVKAHAKYITQDLMSGGKGLGATSLVVQGRGSDKFLEKHPLEVFAEGTNIKVPIMGGTTRDEGTTFLSNFYDLFKIALILDERYFQRNLTSDMLSFFGLKDTHGFLNDAYRSIYFGSKRTQLREMYAGLVDICGVLLMKQATYSLLRSMSYTGTTYAYSFNFYGEVSKLRASEPKWNKKYPFPAGVGHSDDLGYLFPSVKHNYTARELQVVRTMTRLWTNFIRFGSPVLPNDPFRWPTMNNPYGPYLRITDAPHVRENFLEEYMIAAREGFLSSSSPSTRIPILDILVVFIVGLTLLR